ncbi:putative 1,4-beta-D-glucan cellobiohydrolase [Rhizoctonia solani 123E]|uniref:Glucanase n=1 Tax=Rhizoctonia solani 123E TaxID=1423351 RepID=A0A074RRD2_9AGAM|nr:putative 1,4-beta-D-glucan cellobiohydrolase [Rhizoctonia solani 123E]
MVFTTLLLSSLLCLASAQQPGTLIPEIHPTLSWQLCTKSGGCQPQSQGRVVLDAEWRWVHAVDNYSNCVSGNSWDFSLCPDPTTCAKNCALDGVDYSGQFGITTSGTSLTLRPTQYNYKSGSRVYLMANDTNYQLFKLKNQEFTFDVDVGNIPCGFDGGLYFAQMDADGGISRYPGNKAGAKYGTGYCDAKCPRNVKFINGQANVLNWQGSNADPNTGFGLYGTCCNEIDIWAANSYSTTSIANPCTVQGQTRCSGSECTSYCDSDGCDFNPYRLGNLTYYGQGMTINTTKKITVVTQFITADNTTTGVLREIRRLYIQNGKVIQNARSPIPELVDYNSITEKYCSAQKAAFNDPNTFASKGSFQALGDASDSGLVLVMSISGNDVTQMRWLDSDYPPDRSPTDPGVARGICRDSPITTPVEPSPMASITFSNLKYGDIGSTYSL